MIIQTMFYLKNKLFKKFIVGTNNKNLLLEQIIKYNYINY